MPRKVQKRGREKDQKIAKQTGGRAQPNSGAIPGMKGDVVDDWILIDSKITEKKSYILKTVDLLKLEKEALDQNRVPALYIELGNTQYGTGDEFVVLRRDDFEAMRKVYDEATEA